MQIPFFKALGLDLSAYFPATMNVDISPVKWKPISSDFTFETVTWTDKHPPETFSFFRCKVLYENNSYDAYVYYPHPETKDTHFQDESTLEIIAEKIENMAYGSAITVVIEEGKIDLV